MLCEKFDNIRWGSPETERFARYWRSLEPGSLVPRRRSFDPTRIAPLLPGIALYEVLSPDEIVCRLAGTALVDHFGMELTGRNFLDFWPGDMRDAASRTILECITRPCGVFSKVLTHSAAGKTEMIISVGFPLRDDKDICCRMVFYTGEFERERIRVPRDDQVASLEAPTSIFIDLEEDAT
ncbi:PAS domain-containing protein [Sneathiella sp.]|uniref:PAS domain-containing protein n=1 Tax=Sneathiella sp. TaxID=1964365 RepID=UPI002FE2AD31